MDAEPVAVVAGRGARMIRTEAGLTLEEVAKCAKYYGLPWTGSRVAAFESGHVSPTITTFLVVAVVLETLTEKPVALGDLFVGDGRVMLTDTLSIPVPVVKASLEGAAVDVQLEDMKGAREWLVDALVRGTKQLRDLKVKVDHGKLEAVLSEMRESDLKAARTIGADRINAAAGMAKLWGRTFVAERDSRAGPGANAQKKGRVSRELLEELKAVLDGG
jgi:transcriptional regulator with XRE-family HTH domain